MFVLVNASPPKRLDIATSYFADALVSSKAGTCNGVSSTEVWFCLGKGFRILKINLNIKRFFLPP